MYCFSIVSNDLKYLFDQIALKLEITYPPVLFMAKYPCLIQTFNKAGQILSKSRYISDIQTNI